MTDFAEAIAQAYAVEGAAIELGRGVHDGKLEAKALVQLPLATANRHGLIAGATGTGKTRTLQLIAEQLSAAGVSVFAADYKGDLSGMAEPGAADGPAPKRMAELGEPYQPAAFPVEFLALGGIGPGVPVRATVSDFGPQLLGKVLSANETQEQSLELVFRFADQKGLGLLDLADLRALLTYLDSDDGKDELKGLGGVSKATIGVLLRALVGLEDGGGNEFFGEPQLEIADLLRTTPDGKGVISCLELAAVQDKPGLFSTALMWLLAELFEQLPEVGDLEKPKLVFFFDEAHLLFDGATKPFLDSVERTVRMIRSKGVGDLLRHPVADRPAVGGARPARRADPTRPPRLHARGCGRAPQDRPHVPEVRVLRPGEAADGGRDRRGRGHDPVGARRADSGRAHEAGRAAIEHDAELGRGCGGKGIAPLREVRDAAGARERARGARETPGTGTAGAGSTNRSRNGRAARSSRRRRATPSPTSCARVRARRSNARSSAASSGCCGRVSDPLERGLRRKRNR